MIITILITIIAYQFIIFVLSLANKYDNEKVQIALCGVWSIIGLVFIRNIAKLYRKYKLHWFNTHFTRCVFHNNERKFKRVGATFVFYVKNTEIEKLNQDETKTYYIELTPEHKAKNIDGMNFRKNRGQDFLIDLNNPPYWSGYSGDYIAKWLK